MPIHMQSSDARRESSRDSSIARRILLFCGILASLLYAAMLVFVPMRWERYRSASQVVSELSAIDAPSRSVWVPLGRTYAVLALAFGIGIWRVAAGNRRLRVAGGALVAQSLVSVFWPPMHLRGAVPTLTDTMHIVFATAWLLLMLTSMAFAAAALGRRFRLYSAATLVVFVVFGTLTGIGGPRIAANLPTPWIGVWERINIGASLLWVVVLAIILLRATRLVARRKAGPGVHRDASTALRESLIASARNTT